MRVPLAKTSRSISHFYKSHISCFDLKNLKCAFSSFIR
eukprot:CAMPEP_0178963406 /NCGR_PEP_ID=MMETSP0789-20121207/15006_1 /TAXON_ID=3005 /ORGANISM="Rhizosolenia setigera, Strain CCMP 1694" /LENGTH=37 /DNA_ID= /DNA_START= /DNA_END= /DNA_ORIENTATION=